MDLGLGAAVRDWVIREGNLLVQRNSRVSLTVRITFPQVGNRKKGAESGLPKEVLKYSKARLEDVGGEEEGKI